MTIIDNYPYPTSKKLILSLLQADLTHHKLIYGLDTLGLESHVYNLNLSQTIFTLIGLEGTDQHYDFYYRLTDKLNKIPLKHLKPEVEKLALEMYEELMALDR